MENLYVSFKEFRKGKRKKQDVQIFERYLEDNLFLLHNQLKSKTYRHSDYSSFYVTDPKLRHIHKACVRDRIIHQALYRILYFIFDKNFIYDSYSCRINKGTHRAVCRLEKFTRKAGCNYTKSCFALKCDIKKFFNSVSHQILFKLIKRKIKDKNVLWLTKEVINSFSLREKKRGDKNGLPLGNLTSQLFANIYLNELDQFVKHRIKAKYYIRYCDDFVILTPYWEHLEYLVSPVDTFLKDFLKVRVHPGKINIRKLKQGIDLLGYVALPHHRVLRTKTRKRMLKRINQNNLASYLGLLNHCNSYKLKKQVIQKLEIFNSFSYN